MVKLLKPKLLRRSKEMLENNYKIPREILDGFKKKTYYPEEFIDYSPEKVGFILSGEVYAVRYQGGYKYVYPEVLKAGNFLGIMKHINNNTGNWDLEAKSRCIILEIPINHFEKYVTSDKESYSKVLKKHFNFLTRGTEGFFIRILGGTKAFFAYTLYCIFETSEKITFYKYTEFCNIIYSNKTMLYKITKEFEEGGVIKREKGSITVVNPELLKGYFKEYLY